MDTKRIFIDLETTGLDKEKDQLLQLGYIIEINNDIVDMADLKCKPSKSIRLSDFAKDTLGVSMQNLLSDNTRLTQASTLEKFLTLLQSYVNPYDNKDKFQFIGYNCRTFDAPFLREFFERNGNNFYGSYFWEPPIDVMLASAFVLENKRADFKNYKLETLAREFNIAVDTSQCHDALYDVLLTREIYYSLKETRWIT